MAPLKSAKSARTVPLPPWLAARMADYLAEMHPRADEPTAPLWPNRKNGGGHRAREKRYAVPLDWSQPVAMGTFYDTIMKPALKAIDVPASRPATDDTPAVRGVRLHDLRHTFCGARAFGGRPFHAGEPMARAQYLHAYARRLRRLDPRARRRRAERPTRAGCRRTRPGWERRAATAAGAKLGNTQEDRCPTVVADLRNALAVYSDTAKRLVP